MKEVYAQQEKWFIMQHTATSPIHSAQKIEDDDQNATVVRDVEDNYTLHSSRPRSPIHMVIPKVLLGE